MRLNAWRSSVRAGGSHVRKRTGVILLALATALGGCSADARMTREYSTVPEFRREFEDPAAIGQPFLEHLRTIDGGGEGVRAANDSGAFGFIGGVGLLPDGRLLVSDQGLRRIHVLGSDGRHLGFIGGEGQGPGEYISPGPIAVLDSAVIVFDQRQGRASILGPDLEFRSSFTPPSVLLKALVAGPGSTVLITVPGESTQVLRLRHSGEVLGHLAPVPAAVRRIRGAYVADPGAACAMDDSTVGYASSWILEVVGFDVSGSVVRWAGRYRSDILRPEPSREPGVEGELPGGGVLGLACGNRYLVHGAINLRRRVVEYNLFGPAGESLARQRFDADRDSVFPGFIAGLRGDTLVTFRTRPVSTVSFYRVHAPAAQ
jgi:hypothetical protein